MLQRGVDMRALIVEEEIGAERTQEFALVQTTEKERLVDPDVPGAQRADYALVRRRSAGGDQCRTYRARVLRIVRLDLAQGGQEFLERAARQRVARGFDLALGEGVEAAGLIDALGRI